MNAIRGFRASGIVACTAVLAGSAFAYPASPTAPGGAACDLVARGNINGVAYSALLQPDGSWSMRGGGTRSDSALKELATAAQPLTFTCLPPGNGRRAALDL